MKIAFRFILFFSLSLIFFIVGFGIAMPLITDELLPLIGIRMNPNESPSDGIIYAELSVTLLSCASLFAFYFACPIWLVQKLIKQLRHRQYNVQPLTKRIFTKKGKIKKSYWLYQEVLTDLNELAGILQKAEEKQRQLEQAKEEWIRGVSHDLKTPLSYVTGYSALLAQPDYAWSEEEKHQFVQELVAKSEYMGELIRDLNRSFHLENMEQEVPMDPEVFPVYEFVQQVMADIANNPRAFTYSFELSADLNSKNVLLNGDRKLLYRAFANLLMNAVQHNAQHTEIHVAIAAISEKHVCITIQDNGTGIPEEVFSQLHDLQPNVLTERLTGSEHGIGLVIARKMIEAHDGTLSVSSQIGKGTTLHILLKRYG